MLSTEGRFESVCWEMAFFSDFGGLSSERKMDEAEEVIESRPPMTELPALESRPWDGYLGLIGGRDGGLKLLIDWGAEIEPDGEYGS